MNAWVKVGSEDGYGPGWRELVRISRLAGVNSVGRSASQDV